MKILSIISFIVPIVAQPQYDSVLNMLNGACANRLMNTCTFSERCTLTAPVVGNVVCSCPIGFKGTGVGEDGCPDIDECYENEHTCSSSEKCINTKGSFECKCLPGFEMNANTDKCTDINECSLEGICGSSQDASCTNFNGGYECICKDSTKVMNEAKLCVDKNECTYNGGAENGCKQICVNLEPGYSCACDAGYVLNPDGKTCADIDECAKGTHTCRSTCYNTRGSFSCECSEEYGQKFDEETGTCVNLNECLEYPNICGSKSCCKDLEPNAGMYLCSSEVASNTPSTVSSTINNLFGGGSSQSAPANECLLSAIEIQGFLNRQIPDTPSAANCQSACASDPSCNYFNFFAANFTCHLLASEISRSTVYGTTAGPRSCISSTSIAGQTTTSSGIPANNIINQIANIFTGGGVLGSLNPINNLPLSNSNILSTIKSTIKSTEGSNSIISNVQNKIKDTIFGSSNPLSGGNLFSLSSDNQAIKDDTSNSSPTEAGSTGGVSNTLIGAATSGLRAGATTTTTTTTTTIVKQAAFDIPNSSVSDMLNRRLQSDILSALPKLASSASVVSGIDSFASKIGLDTLTSSLGLSETLRCPSGFMSNTDWAKIRQVGLLDSVVNKIQHSMTDSDRDSFWKAIANGQLPETLLDSDTAGKALKTFGKLTGFGEGGENALSQITSWINFFNTIGGGGIGQTLFGGIRRRLETIPISYVSNESVFSPEVNELIPKATDEELVRVIGVVQQAFKDVNLAGKRATERIVPPWIMTEGKKEGSVADLINERDKITLLTDRIVEKIGLASLVENKNATEFINNNTKN